MAEEEKKLDASIQELNSQIRKQFLDNEQMRQFHYITYDDMLNIYKTMNGGDNSKSMIVIAAPKGTSLEMGEEEHGESILKMDSSGKGRIRVYTCNNEHGVEELDLTKDQE